MKRVIVIAAVVLALGGLTALFWWQSQPHSAADQLSRARDGEAALREKMTDLSPEALVRAREEAIRSYEKVCQDFSDDGSHDDARQRVAEVYEELAQDKVRAAEAYERLLAESPASELAESATRNLARLYREIGLAEKDQARSLPWYQKAVDLLEKYLAAHGEAAWAEEATMEVARLRQDYLKLPPSEAKEALDRYLQKYPQGKHLAEAHYRLGRWYEDVQELQEADREYKMVTGEFAHSPYADQALTRREELQAKKLNNPEEAAKIARQLAERHRGTPAGARYAQRAGELETKGLKQKDRQYEGEYYGAPIVDVTVDKPLPFEQYAEIIDQKLDTIGYQLDVAIDPEGGKLTVAGEMQLINGGERKETLLLQLNGAMTFEEVKLDGAPAEVTQPSRPGRDVVGLKLSKPWAAGARSSLTFRAAGKFDPPTAVPEGIDLESGKMPTPEEQEKIMATLQGDPRVRIGPTGYAISGGAWYPLTYYGDIFTADVTYRVSSPGVEVLGTGRLTVPEGSSGSVRRWFSETPMFGLYFAYGKYVPVETPWSDGRVIVAYVAEGREAMGRKLGQTARDILNFYEPKFGRLKQPRISIGVVRLPVILGGLGPAGMLLLAEHFVGENGPAESLLAHELAHQWWGNAVPVSFLKGYSLWLSEGFATYSDALYHEHASGREFLVRHLRKYGLFYFEGQTKVPGAVQPVALCTPENPLYRQTVYEKGALALHTLRYLLGDEKFFESLRRYAAECEGRHSTIEDFRRVAESVSGQDLRVFFDQWLRRPGLPHYIITGLESGSDADGPYTVVVRQEVPHAEGPWRTPLDIGFYGPGGQSHLVRKAKVEEEDNRITVRLPWKPERVELDPEHWVFRHPGPDNVWPHPADEPPAE